MRKKYKIKRIFYTIQGEGRHIGSPSVFVRMSGCNLWSGREKDRLTGKGSCSLWCDADFLGGSPYSAAQILDTCEMIGNGSSHVVITGGEPSLQLDEDLVSTLSGSGKYVCVETNGTKKLPEVDWVTFSPKAGGAVNIDRCDEIKIVYPSEINPLDFDEFPAGSRYVSPKNNTLKNLSDCYDFCMKHPRWSVTLQLQKVLGVE